MRLQGAQCFASDLIKISYMVFTQYIIYGIINIDKGILRKMGNVYELDDRILQSRRW